MRIALAQRADEMAAALEPAEDLDLGLVERFRAGDRRAFDELVRKYQRPIYYMVLRYVKDGDEAKDVAQRAFVRAFEGLAGFRADAAFRTWLYRIAVNLALNHLRDHRRHVEVDETSATVEAVGAGRLADAQARGRLRAALDALPPKQRLVLELRVYEELPFREVAEIAGCSENAAKVNFHHAVKRLRERLLGPCAQRRVGRNAGDAR